MRKQLKDVFIKLLTWLVMGVSLVFLWLAHKAELQHIKFERREKQ